MVMGNRLKSILNSKDELNEELKSYKCILSRDIYNYLESMANLEISGLRQENISGEQADTLAELKLYRELLYYNICGRALTYKEKNTPKYFEDDYINSFSVNYGDLVNNVALINVGQSDSLKVNVSLANYFEPTFEDILISYNDKLESLKKSSKIFRDSFKGSKGSSNSENLYNRLKKYSLEDLEKIWKREIEFARRQNDFYKKFMDDTNLEYTSDFELINDGSLILNEDSSKVYIKKQVKTPIFR